MFMCIYYNLIIYGGKYQKTSAILLRFFDITVYEKTPPSWFDQFLEKAAFFHLFIPSPNHFTDCTGNATHFLASHSIALGDFHNVYHNPATVRYGPATVVAASHPSVHPATVVSHLSIFLSLSKSLSASICPHFAPATTGKANGAASPIKGTFSTRSVHFWTILCVASTIPCVIPATSPAVSQNHVSLR